MSDSRVFDLLAEWERSRQAGAPASAEQLCPDDPTLQDALRRLIRRQERARALIEPPVPQYSSPVPVVEGYDILGVVGSGGMGIVYRARDRRLDRVVALKMILAGGTDPRQRARFRDEARAGAALQHPNIVQVFETGEAGGQPFLALEYIPGGSLAARTGGAPLGPRRAAELVAALAGAVQHAHDRGVVHRDLKPANILLAPDGTPKVADFGLAKRLAEDSAHTRTGAVVGSPSYMAPEQAVGDSRAVGPATDVHALGAILYELLTGRPPFVGETVLETIRQVSEHPAAEPRLLRPDVPRDLEVICLKCLEKAPADRYASAADLAADLGRFLAGEPIRARPPSVMGALSRNLARRNFDPNFAAYGRVLLALAPLPLAVHVIAYFALRDRDDYPVLMTAVSLVLVVLIQVPLHWYMLRSPLLRDVPPVQKRHFYTGWAANIVVCAATWLLVWVVVPPGHLGLMFLIYPLWMVHVGHTYLSFAADIGSMYVYGAVFILLSTALVFVLPWTPLILGGLMFVNMVISGLYVRRGATAPPPANR